MTETLEFRKKPLGRKAYGSIPHLPGSRMGPGDHHCHEGQGLICTTKTRDRHDVVIVEEKLDGSCVSVARLEGEILPLGRAGYLAISSPYEQHRLFANWAWENRDRFLAVLQEGERVVGEWLAQAHGTRYDLTGREPFVAFDLIRGEERLPWAERNERLALGAFTIPHAISTGGPMSVEAVLEHYARHGSAHGALDPVEGAIWRVERRGKVDFLAKYVRPDKCDGCFLPEITGEAPLWNWRPEPKG